MADHAERIALAVRAVAHGTMEDGKTYEDRLAAAVRAALRAVCGHCEGGGRIGRPDSSWEGGVAWSACPHCCGPALSAPPEATVGRQRFVAVVQGGPWPENGATAPPEAPTGRYEGSMDADGELSLEPPCESCGEPSTSEDPSGTRLCDACAEPLLAPPESPDVPAALAGADEPTMALSSYWWGREIPLDAVKLAGQSIAALRDAGFCVEAPPEAPEERQQPSPKRYIVRPSAHAGYHVVIDTVDWHKLCRSADRSAAREIAAALNGEATACQPAPPEGEPAFRVRGSGWDWHVETRDGERVGGVTSVELATTYCDRLNRLWAARPAAPAPAAPPPLPACPDCGEDDETYMPVGGGYGCYRCGNRWEAPAPAAEGPAAEPVALGEADGGEVERLRRDNSELRKGLVGQAKVVGRLRSELAAARQLDHHLRKAALRAYSYLLKREDSKSDLEDLAIADALRAALDAAPLRHLNGEPCDCPVAPDAPVAAPPVETVGAETDRIVGAFIQHLSDWLPTDLEERAIGVLEASPVDTEPLFAVEEQTLRNALERALEEERESPAAVPAPPAMSEEVRRLLAAGYEALQRLHEVTTGPKGGCGGIDNVYAPGILNREQWNAAAAELSDALTGFPDALASLERAAAGEAPR